MNVVDGVWDFDPAELAGSMGLPGGFGVVEVDADGGVWWRAPKAQGSWHVALVEAYRTSDGGVAPTVTWLIGRALEVPIADAVLEAAVSWVRDVEDSGEAEW